MIVLLDADHYMDRGAAHILTAHFHAAATTTTTMPLSLSISLNMTIATMMLCFTMRCLNVISKIKSKNEQQER